MHVLEHIGLGRYGDQLNPTGDLRAASELGRIVRSGGQLLIVEPVNQQPRISFNAHRIYSYYQVTAMFPGFELDEFTLIQGREIFFDTFPDRIVNADIETNDTACFRFVKR
jgi:hypothetical protein